MGFELLLIDMQNDFCAPNGTMYIRGAEEDCSRVANFINTNRDNIDMIHMTQDMHPFYHIAHPIFWKTKSGDHPAEYTLITHADFSSGIYKPVNPELEKRVEDYLLNLEARGRYVLTIWPPHCLVATEGACICKEVWEAAHAWEKDKPGRIVDYIAKASNPMTEHYSAIQAEVPDPADPSTRINFTLIDKLKGKDIVIAGEALSHCVSNTIRDLCVYIPASRITLLLNCTRNVEGFDEIGTTFLEEYKNKGLHIVNSTDFHL